MKKTDKPCDEKYISPLALAKKQRSHILFVLSNSVSGLNRYFLNWYKKDYLHSVVNLDKVLSVQHYERCEVRDDWPLLAYQYMGVYELSLDGAEEAGSIIQWVTDSHNKEKSAASVATWLCYPLSEKVGRSSKIKNPLLIVTFTNGMPGFESDFREWSCTRHSRNALNSPGNAGIQCFGITNFQSRCSEKTAYDLITVYEQDYTLEETYNFLDTLSSEQAEELNEKFAFPTLDRTRYGNFYSRPITDKLHFIS